MCNKRLDVSLARIFCQSFADRVRKTRIFKRLYSDSNYTTLVEDSGNQSVSGITGLRYFGIKNRGDTQNNGGSTTGAILPNIEIYDGISSTTNKPTNIQDNSLLVEKDVARRYWFSAESARTPTFEDDTFSTGWTETGSGSSWSVTNNALTFVDSSAGTERLYYDNTSTISDTAWVTRFKLNITAFTQGTSATSEWVLFGWSSTTADSASTQDAVLFTIRNNSGNASFAVTANGSGAPNGSLGQADLELLQTGTFYIEVIRDGNDFTLNVRSNSHSGTLLGTKSYTVSNVSSLRYLKAMNHDTASTDANTAGNIDDVEFYDGVTSTTTPAIWINEFGVSDGLMFGGISTASYAVYSDSQSWNGVSWTAGGSLTGARQNGASAGTGSTSARYVNGYNDSPAPYPNSNRNESYNGTSWTSDTVHPDSVNNKIHGGCGTADSMLVSGGHKNGTGDLNNYYKWTGSWTSITASGVSGSVSTSGTLNSALLTRTTSARTWNGTSWSTSTATSTSRTTASKSGLSSSSGIRLFDWANTNPFNSTSEIWNGTSWSASGNTPSGRTDAGDIDVSTESMMTLGGQESYGGTTHSTTVYELRKGVFTTGASFSNSRRACGGAGS